MTSNLPIKQYTNPPQEYLHRIQVLRFVAAALVLFGHVLHGVQGTEAVSFGPTNLYAAGVDIFFVLSGFIMFTIARQDFGVPGASLRFLLRRFIRVVPAYWFFTTAMLLAVQIFPARLNHPDTTLLNIVSSYLFIPSENAYGQTYPVLLLGWTLNFEVMFYVLFGLGLLLPRVWGLTFIAGTIAVLGFWGETAAPASGPLAFWCNPIVFEFLLGIALGRLREGGLRLSEPAAWAVTAGSLVALWFFSSKGGNTPFAHERVIWMGLPALALCAAAALVQSERPQGTLTRWAVAAGDASYALYLSHPFTLGLVGWAASAAGLQLPGLFVALACVCCIAVAVVFHRQIERPVTRWLTERLSMPKPVPPALPLRRRARGS